MLHQIWSQYRLSLFSHLQSLLPLVIFCYNLNLAKTAETPYGHHSNWTKQSHLFASCLQALTLIKWCHGASVIVLPHSLNAYTALCIKLRSSMHFVIEGVNRGLRPWQHATGYQTFNWLTRHHHPMQNLHRLCKEITVGPSSKNVILIWTFANNLCTFVE